MNVSFGIINNSLNAAPFLKKPAGPTFCGGLSKDAFVKSAEKVVKSGIDIEKLKEVIPEYLYHLTNNKAYESIQKEGILKVSKDMIDGVFMFDLNDFMKNWTKPCGKSQINISTDIMKQAIKSGEGLVLLKIPTKKLNPKKFVIRLEDEVLDFVGSKHYNNLAMVFC